MIIASVYLILATAATLYAWYEGSFNAAHSEFAGMPLIILALPWSFVFHQFNPRILASEYNNSILVEDIFILLNVALLFVGSFLIRYITHAEDITA